MARKKQAIATKKRGKAKINSKGIKSLEEKQIRLEKKQLEELEELTGLEEQIKKMVEPKPLRKITKKDFYKGVVGAFIGVGVHYTFTYGVAISEQLDVHRANVLYLLSLVIAGTFIYATGFRKVEVPKYVFLFIPFRLLVLYGASLLVSLFVLILFYPTFLMLPLQVQYIQLATLLLPAIIGACTADLIGKE